MRAHRGTLFHPTFAFPMVSVCVLAGAFLVYYFPITARQGETLDRRAFRALAAVADSVAARVANYTEVLHQGAKAAGENRRRIPPRPPGRAEFVVAHDRGRASGPLADDCRGGAVTFDTKPLNGEHELVLSCGSWVGTVTAGVVMAPYLDDALYRLFDEILLTNVDGLVLHQTRRTGARVTSLASVALRPIAATGDEREGSSEKQDDSPAFAVFSRSSVLLETDIAGDRYRAYLLPIALQQSRESPAATADLVLVGLISADRFRAESMRVPGTALIAAILLVLIAIAAAWPLLKFATMGATERLPRRSAAYLLLSTLATIVFVAILAMHLRYAVHRTGVDATLQTLAARIERNLVAEVKLALRVLDSAPHSEPFQAAIAQAPHDTCEPHLSSETRLAHTTAGLLAAEHVRLSDYPYFDRIFWSDSRGFQHIKWDAGRPTSATYIGDRSYFTETVADRLWRVAGSAPGAPRFRIDSVLSRNTGEYRAVISQAAPKIPLCPGVELRVVSMVTPLLSVIEPVLPPDYGFAILGGDDTVLFHSTPEKNLAERFLDEVEERDEIEAALFTRRGTLATTRYLGADHRLFVTPVTALEGSPWSLVVFQDLSEGATEHLERIMLFSVLAIACFATFAGIVLALPSSRGTPDWLWPREERRPVYVHLIVTMAAVAALVRLLMFELSVPAAILAVGWLVPAMVLGMTAVTLRPIRRVVPRMLFAALAAALIAIVWSEPQATGDLLPLVAGILAVLVLLPLRSLSSWLFALWPASLKTAYTAVWAAALAVMALVPCMAFFRVAYNYHGNVTARRQQVQTLAALAERETRVKRLYGERMLAADAGAGDVARWLFLRRRLAATTDRYDLVLGTAGSGQLISPETADPGACDDGLPTYLRAAAAVDVYAATPRTRAFAADVPDEQSAWLWCRDGLNRLRIRSRTAPREPQDALTLPPARALFKYVSRDPTFLNPELVTELPHLPPWPLLPSTLALFGTAFVCFLWMRPTIRQMFLLDVRPAPSLPSVVLQPSTPFPENAVLLTLDRTAAIRALRGRDDVRILDCASLPDTQGRGCDVGDAPIVVLDHFDYRLDDAATNAKKLQVLEHLSAPASTKRVVVLSSLDPIFYFGPESDLSERPSLEALAPGRDMERWATVLSGFRRVRVELTATRPPVECGRRVWATCTTAERVSLYQLAHDGWVNPRNEAALRELEQRGLIAARPYRFTDPAFEAFVSQNISADDRRVWQRQDTSHIWEGIRLMLVVLMLGVLAVALFFSQQSTLGVIATGLGVLTPLAKLLSEANSVRALLGLGKGGE